MGRETWENWQGWMLAHAYKLERENLHSHPVPLNSTIIVPSDPSKRGKTISPSARSNTTSATPRPSHPNLTTCSWPTVVVPNRTGIPSTSAFRICADLPTLKATSPFLTGKRRDIRIDPQVSFINLTLTSPFIGMVEEGTGHPNMSTQVNSPIDETSVLTSSSITVEFGHVT